VREDERVLRRRLEARRAVEARFLDAGEDGGAARAEARVQIREDPARGARVVVLVVRHQVVPDPNPEPRGQLREVVAVLLLLLLGEQDEAAALGDEALDRVELLRCEARAAGARNGALPLRLRRVRDHDRGGAGERPAVERAVGVRVDREAASSKRVGRARVRGVLGMRRLHRPRHLRPDRPRLAVRLVEYDATDVRMRGHERSVRARPA
jgi:hypothetical protein